MKKTNIINIKSFLSLFLLLITLISLSHYLSFTSSSPPTFAQSTTGKTNLENSQIKDKLSTNAPSPGSDITSNISLILTPAPDIINPTDNEDFQVPEENLKAGSGDDKTAEAGAAGNSYSEGKSLITPNSNQIKANNGSGTADTIKPTVITPANSKKTATSGSDGEPSTVNSYSKGKSLITASSSNQSKTNNGSGTADTIKPTVITPANSKNASTAIKDNGKQGNIGTYNSTNSTNTDNKTASPNTYPNGKPLDGNATNNAADATTANVTSNITASSSSSNQSKTNNGSGTADTIKPTVITPANSKNASTAIKDNGKQGNIGTYNSTNSTNTDNKTIYDTSLTGNNKSSTQEINANNSVIKSSNTSSNKTGQQGSSAFPWLDQISKILGVK